MKIDRRSFLAFVLGGAAGTTLSPLPWKLTDDLAIWTQNWPWTPVPEDGEPGTIASVVQRGYKLGSTLLRAAKVLVYVAPEPDGSDAPAEEA